VTPRAVLVMGFGNSGCAAVTDLLGEVEGFHCPPQEFSLFEHPDGLLALEDAMVSSWTQFSAEWALRRYRDLVHVLARPSTRFRFGQDYARFFCSDFEEISLAYLRELTDLTYEGYYMFRRAEMSRAEYFGYLLSLRFKLDAGHRYFSRKYETAVVVDADQFTDRTRAYTSRLLRSMTRESGASDVALLQGGSPYHVERSNRAFESAASIIVDRDPRDIYLSARAATYLPREVGAFVRWFKATRERAWQKGDAKAMKVLFEDIVTDYDEQVARIFDFLALDPARHTKKRTRLQPEASAKRIAKWKSYPRQDEIRRIEEELGPYLWRPRQG
jgi:hypothetical protein